MSKPKKTTQKKKSISKRLLFFLVPMMTVSIVLLTLFVALQARNVIVNQSQNRLIQESRANAESIGRKIETIGSYIDSFAQTASATKYASNDELLQAMKPSLDAFEGVNGIYMYLDDGTYLDATDWVPPADYVAEERDWYIVGKGKDKATLGEPYLDMAFGGMLVTYSREFKLLDGRTGVMACDMEINDIVETVAQYRPMDVGSSILMDGDYILSYTNQDFNGTKSSEHTDDAYLTRISKIIADGGTDDVLEMKGYDGKMDNVTFTNVPGTEWTLVSEVDRGSVLASLNRFMIISFVIMAFIIVVIAIVMSLLMRKFVSIPVGELTEDIVRISDGDFRVDINNFSDDEIGTMNRNMQGYIEKMRINLGDIQEITKQLANEAANSRDASERLNEQAYDQSRSMGQIRATMDDMSLAVGDLANNATELAQEVGSLNKRGEFTKTTMGRLVEKAQNGQSDMADVQEGMKKVVSSMTDMNNVVEMVGESTQQVNSIIEMISSIAAQTNLLSLNASIEAARAGEAGKGFAVVASEIGNLAQSSQESAVQISEIVDEITKQIETLSHKSKVNMEEMESGARAVDVAGETFAQIFKQLDEASNVVDDMIHKVGNVDEIATSLAAISEEQSASTEEVSASVDVLAESANAVAEGSKNVDESANTVLSSAKKIEEFIDFFKIS
ncbi:MAG: methyl-accepting chemotaxis protein [Lachnospiraceae bacterium]|nr:methyl-accepting chemotaxis protein [Lachnospiraceae bacterium]